MCATQEDKQVLSEMEGKLEGVLAIGQQLLLTCYMGGEKRASATHTLGERKEENGSMSPEVEPAELANGEEPATNGAVPADRFVVELPRSKKSVSVFAK